MKIQIVCPKVKTTFKNVERKEFGKTYGDESEEFIKLINVIVRFVKKDYDLRLSLKIF